VAPNGYKRRQKEAKIPIESGLGWHLVWVDSITPGRVPAFEEVEAQAKE
jgi:parvulin-like peptidyl-prolyl isomerase